ncbi:hypothetical protein EZS27_008323 [termite gut metagenome]|uniref:Uncharacterized protein n=1 Tax=termite gut metagenome TaxID=433724 RepID=A0A5J4SCY4_9ZZZZ
MGKGNLSADLQQLASILQKEKICFDTTPLKNVIGDLKKNQGTYNLQKLKLKIDAVPNNTRPSVTSLEILLNVQIAESVSNENNICNPISTYNFSIEIVGKNEGKTVHSSWHLDYDNAVDSECMHPSFHLTYGGKTMKSTELGNVLLLPAPRISYPPMDAILGVDFVLSNFVKKDTYNKIKADSQYKAAVRRSQQRLWRPYMLSVANHWCKFTNCQHFSINNNLGKEYQPTLID